MLVAVSVSALVLAAVFALAGTAKLLHRAETRRAVGEFGAPAPLVAPIAIALPVLELFIAGALFVPALARWAALTALALLLVFCAAIVRALARGEAPDCNCFGGLTQTEVGRGTLARNLALGALAAFTAFGAGGETTGALSWIGQVDDRNRVAAIVIAALTAAVIALGWFCWQLLRQNGRLLLRLDAQASELGSGEPAPDLPPLAVGSPAPEFRTATVDGQAISIASLLAPALPVALVFADTHCTACEGALEEAARSEREHAGAVTVAVVMRGDGALARERAQALGLGRVVHDQGDALFKAFRVRGAPGALTIDRQGRVATALGMGAEGAREAIAAASRSAPLVTVQVSGR